MVAQPMPVTSGRSLNLPGQRDRENTAFAGGAVHRHLAGVRLDNMLDDGQPQPRATAPGCGRHRCGKSAQKVAAGALSECHDPGPEP